MEQREYGFVYQILMLAFEPEQKHWIICGAIQYGNKKNADEKPIKTTNGSSDMKRAGE